MKLQDKLHEKLLSGETMSSCMNQVACQDWSPVLWVIRPWDSCQTWAKTTPLDPVYSTSILITMVHRWLSLFNCLTSDWKLSNLNSFLWQCCLFGMLLFLNESSLVFCSDTVAPKNKGQWRGRNRRGNNYYGRFSSQEHYRQQRDSSDRKDGYNQPQRRGTVADRRPPSRSPFQSKVGVRKVLVFYSSILPKNIPV